MSSEDRHSNFHAAKEFVEHNRRKKIESLSGRGSRLDHAKESIVFISNIIETQNIKTILDLGCGDWNWFRYVTLGDAQYTGWDCDEQMLAANYEKADGKNVTFQCMDICTADLKPVDLILCRDVLFHLRKSVVTDLINRISKASNFLITTRYDTKKNLDIISYVDIDDWGFYKINTDLPPFDLLDFKKQEILEPKNSHTGNNRYLTLYEFNT